MALIVGLAFFLNLFPGVMLEAVHIRVGLVLSEGLFIAGPVLVGVRWFYLDRKSVLPFGWPSNGALAAAILGTVGLNHLLNLAGDWQEKVFPTPEVIRSFFESQFVYRGPLDYLLLLFVFAIVPAICEEVLFRGFVQAGLVRVFESGPAGIVLTSLVFAAFHLDPWRFLGVWTLGLFLGALAYRTGSLIPSILAHGLNNILSITLTVSTSDHGFWSGSLWSVATALLLVGAAAAILRHGRSRAAIERML